MRRNRAPIILNCFSRGGSNIFWNLLLTHPDACSPILETLEIFRTGWRAPTRTGYRLFLMTRQLRLFDQSYLRPRRRLSEKAKRFIDETLFEWKMKTATDRDMRFKGDGVEYTAEEVAEGRLTIKNNNGLAFLSETFADIYPDVSFLALVRHPVSLYESHKRRKLARSPEHFCGYFNRLAEKILHDRDTMDRYHIMRFEDILADPLAAARQAYELTGLDPARVSKIRLKAKPHVQRDGSYGSPLEVRRHYWLAPEEVPGFFEPAINQLQSDRLSEAERTAVLTGTAPVLERLGYGS